METYVDKLDNAFIAFWKRYESLSPLNKEKEKTASNYYIALGELIELGHKLPLVQLLRGGIEFPPEFLPLLGDIINECANKQIMPGKRPFTTRGGKNWFILQMTQKRHQFPTETAMFEAFSAEYGNPETGEPTASYFRKIWHEFKANP